MTSGFTGFGPGLQTFFKQLARNQNRDWFQEHRPAYEAEIRAPMAELVGSLTLAFVAHDVPLRGDPKTSIFRINRDIRFSKNKHPYKTNASAVWTRDATRKAQGLLYFQAGMDGAFAAAGFYGPEPDQLHALRTAIAADPARWLAIEKTLERHDLPLSTERTLTRLPRGFDAETAGHVAHAIRCTSFVISRTLTTKEISRPDLVDALADLAVAAMPLLAFGWQALATLPPRRT